MITVQNRNTTMIGLTESAAVRYPFRFTVAGDSGVQPNSTSDGIFTQLLDQMEQLNPKPIFFANLGDFCGPGTSERHAHYLRLVERLSIPNVCVMGNHDMDDPAGWDLFQQFHGPQNFQFAYGNTRFIAINCQPGTNGPRAEDLEYLERALKDDDHVVRIVLMHMPPNLNNHYAPRVEWSFANHEKEFVSVVRAHKVRLVCCAHVTAYDYHVHDGIPYVVSGGGGWAVCPEYESRQVEPPSQRGSFHHFVAVTVTESGRITGQVIRAYAGIQGDPKFRFTA